MDTPAAEAAQETAVHAPLCTGSAVTSDAYFSPSSAEMDMLFKSKPWDSVPMYFTSVKLSVVAAVKMFIHAKSGAPSAEKDGRGNWFEVMGMLQGHYRANEFIITDSFGIPVSASEVECEMNESSTMYMVDYLSYAERTGRREGCVGWYHSHPGYSCFLSGTDVATQQLSQNAQDPWLAIVVDPVQTISTGRLEVKAFRTHPESFTDHEPSGASRNAERFNIPTAKIEEYGVHMRKYYELPITLVRSTTDALQLDLLWSRYWTTMLSANPLLANRYLAIQHVHQLAETARSVAVSPASSNEAPCPAPQKANRSRTTKAETVAALRLHSKEQGRLLASARRSLPTREMPPSLFTDLADSAVSLPTALPSTYNPAVQSSKADSAWRVTQLNYLLSTLTSDTLVNAAIMEVKNAVFIPREHES